MNKYIKHQATEHAIEQLRERFYPGISDDKARELLEKLAKRAKPLKTSRMVA